MAEVIARRPGQYLVKTGPKQGRIVDERGYHDEMFLPSLLARGYWEADDSSLDDIEEELGIERPKSLHGDTYRDKLAAMQLEWDEAKHERDAKGRFAEQGGVTAEKGPLTSEGPEVRVRAHDDYDPHDPIDQKRKAFMEHIAGMEKGVEALDAKRDALAAAWKQWSKDTTEGRKKPLKPDGAAAKKLPSYKEAKRLEDAFHAHFDAHMEAQRQMHAQAREMLKVPPSEQSDVAFKGGQPPLHPAVVSHAERALEVLRQFDGSGAFTALKVPADKVEQFREVFGDDTHLKENADGTFSMPVTVGLASATSGRAHATMQGVFLAGGRGDLDGQVYHEVAHHIEFRNSTIRQAAIDLREKLADKPREVYKLNTGSSRSLGDDEVAVRGKFPDPYSAKVYPNDVATEMISTGVESYMIDPVGFARDRPEHFKLIFDVLHGKYKGK